jgi:dephospho-CoA kinase
VLLKIAVTGGVGSGKTTVCQCFEKLGACVVDADKITHKLLETTCKQQVIRLLGLKDEPIDRKAVAEIVFHDPKLLSQLEQIVHPAVLNEIEKQYKHVCRNTHYTSFVAEIPLLFEIGAETFYDATIAVLRNTTTHPERMKRQLSPAQKAAKATHVIHNNGTLDELQTEATRVYALITGAL